MMYISVFPIAISVRRTNVYEEKSLGVYGSSAEEEEDEKEPSYVGAHFRRQLSFDLWYIFLGLFSIGLAEGRRLQNTNDYAFTMFSCLFEIVSAYCTVGLSLGYPNINASFAAEFNVISKLVIIAMQIRGRHRGLPYELDRAILLPSEHLHKGEDEDAARRAMQRRNSNSSNIALGGTALFRQTSTPAAYPAASPPSIAAPPLNISMSTGQDSNASKRRMKYVKGGLGKLIAQVASQSNSDARHPHDAEA